MARTGCIWLTGSAGSELPGDLISRLHQPLYPLRQRVNQLPVSGAEDIATDCQTGLLYERSPLMLDTPYGDRENGVELGHVEEPS
jgi:hypothetical protein